jgi:hypothetical protein
MRKCGAKRSGQHETVSEEEKTHSEGGEEEGAQGCEKVISIHSASFGWDMLR